MKVILAVTNDIATDRRVQRIGSTLLRQGADVVIVGRKRKDSLSISHLPFKHKRIRLLFNRGALFYAEYNIRLFIWLCIQPADIITANDLDTLPAVYLCCKLKKITAVYDSHEHFTEVPELINRRLIKKIWAWIESAIVPHIHFASTVSEPIAQDLQQRYHRSFTVIRNLPEKKITENHFPLSFTFPDKPVIIYQGSVNIDRGLEEMIEAMKHITSAILIIAGDGDIQHQLRIRVKSLQLNNRVYFTGRLQPDQLLALTQKAAIGISLEKDRGLNYRYALPNKLFDYIMSGVPVLVSALPEMKKIVQQYNIGVLIDEVTPEAISQAIHGMLENTELYKIWKQNLKIAADQLCWENEEGLVIKLYQRAGLK